MFRHLNVLMTNQHNMKISLGLILFSFIAGISCSPVRETLVDANTGARIAGFDKKCLYRIGKTYKQDLGEDKINNLQADGLHFLFEKVQPSGNREGVLIGVSSSSGKYQTRKGIKVGDSIKKAKEIYGGPKVDHIDFGKDENARFNFIFYGLFYEHLTFMTKSKEEDKIIGIGITKKFGDGIVD